MKSKSIARIAGSLLLLTFSASIIFAQEEMTAGQESTPTLSFRTNPLEGETLEQALAESAAGQTIPMWPYDVTGFYGRYRGAIVGRKYDTRSDDGSGVTKIPMYIVPLVVDFVAYLNGRKYVYWEFDPTTGSPLNVCTPNGSPLAIVQNSPLFQDAPNVWGGTDLGTTQYIDAQLRGEFWKRLQVVAEPWHNKFDVTTLPPQRLEVPYPYWGVSRSNNGKCVVGRIYYLWLDLKLRKMIADLKNQGVGPTNVPLFLTYNVYAWAGGDLGGYHSAYGSPMQVYTMSAFDTSGFFGQASQDITILSHELGELVNDPSGMNYTPAWGRIGQVKGCQRNFEVGDPVTGKQNPVITLNGFDYHPQELAFFSWFFRSRNDGVNGWYSSNGTLRTLQAFCF